MHSTCRYNLEGFVEELPKLPSNRSAHACAILPATPTGVRPDKNSSSRHILMREALAKIFSKNSFKTVWVFLDGFQTFLTVTN